METACGKKTTLSLSLSLSLLEEELLLKLQNYKLGIRSKAINFNFSFSSFTFWMKIKDMDKHQIKSEIYHERQRLQFCLLHALNNLFQEKDAFTRADLDEIAEKLSLDDPNPGRWTPISVVFKPHHNLITGNYDVNVLISALERKGKNVVWHDRRNGSSSIDLEGSNEKGLMGIVVNVPVRRFGGLLKNRHWIAWRKIDGVWYNLDSDLKVPKPFNNVSDVRVFLDGIIHDGGEILLVMDEKQGD